MNYESHNGVEVGQEIEVEGRRYWIAKIIGPDCLEVMPNPDDRPHYKKRSNFWPTFWVIVLIIVILRMVF